MKVTTAEQRFVENYAKPQEDNLRKSENHCTLSVVIAWVNPFELLQPTLDSLLNVSKRKPDEIIVVTRHDESEKKRLQILYPNITLIGAPSNTTITRLRSIGIRHSSGDVIVVTEDHCIATPDWLKAVENKIEQGYDIVGGPIENDCKKRLRDWAAFLTEYAFAILPAAPLSIQDGESKTEPIPGNNVAYKREFLKGLCETLDEDLWESFYHKRLEADGAKMIHEPEMLLYHRHPFDFFYFVKQRYHFCRSFAAMRCKTLNRPNHFKYGVGSLVLPPFLWLRGLLTLVKKRRFVGLYFLCSPLISIYLCAGAFGEMTGYFLGGGNSLEYVE